MVNREPQIDKAVLSESDRIRESSSEFSFLGGVRLTISA